MIVSMHKLTSLILVVAISGCAAHPDPIIDMKGVDEAKLQSDGGYRVLN